jgi:hypothetical protein
VPKSLEGINNEYDLNLSLVVYMRLQESLQFYTRNKQNIAQPSVSLEHFLKTFDKGSKSFRRVLQHGVVNKLKISSLNTVESFFRITDARKPDDTILRLIWGEWNSTLYSNRCRDFLFKVRNNILGLNARVCNFVPNIEAECTLCHCNKEPRPVNSETCLHLFLLCPVTEKYRTETERQFFPEIRNGTQEDKKDFWLLGKMPGQSGFNNFIRCMVNLANFSIWEAKLRKEIIPVSTFIADLKYGTYKVLCNRYIRDSKHKDNFFVCRLPFDPP